MVYVTDRAHVYVRLGALKLCLCHDDLSSFFSARELRYFICA
jgi:hypothetical protein